MIFCHRHSEAHALKLTWCKAMQLPYVYTLKKIFLSGFAFLRCVLTIEVKQSALDLISMWHIKRRYQRGLISR